MVIQAPAAFSCWTERCVRQKPRLLLTYTTNRPYKLLGNNHQEVLFNQNPISNPWVERMTRGLNETTIFRPQLLGYIA